MTTIALRWAAVFVVVLMGFGPAAGAMGAGDGGVRAFTATSGPGLSLMAESISMAAMAEIPVVIIDVMRAGPSTGMATSNRIGPMPVL